MAQDPFLSRRIAGRSLRAVARAMRIPGVSQALLGVMGRLLGLDAIRAVDLRGADARPITPFRVAPPTEPKR